MKRLLMGLFLALLVSQRSVVASAAAASEKAGVRHTTRTSLQQIASVAGISYGKEVSNTDLAQLIIQVYGQNVETAKRHEEYACQIKQLAGVGEGESPEAALTRLARKPTTDAGSSTITWTEVEAGHQQQLDALCDANRTRLERLASQCGVQTTYDGDTLSDQVLAEEIGLAYQQQRVTIEALKAQRLVDEGFRQSTKNAFEPPLDASRSDEGVVDTLRDKIKQLNYMMQFRQRVLSAANFEFWVSGVEDDILIELIQAHERVRTELQSAIRALARMGGEASNEKVLAKLKELEQRRIDFEAGVRKELGIKDDSANKDVLTALATVKTRERHLAAKIRRIARVQGEASDEKVLERLTNKSMLRNAAWLIGGATLGAVATKYWLTHR